MTLQSDIALSVLEAAVKAEIGWQVIIHDPASPIPGKAQRAKSILYRYRNDIGLYVPEDEIPLYKKLIVRLCPTDPNNRLWISKQ